MNLPSDFECSISIDPLGTKPETDNHPMKQTFTVRVAFNGDARHESITFEVSALDTGNTDEEMLLAARARAMRLARHFIENA